MKFYYIHILRDFLLEKRICSQGLSWWQTISFGGFLSCGRRGHDGGSLSGDIKSAWIFEVEVFVEVNVRDDG
jgi:hypothetical protein